MTILSKKQLGPEIYEDIDVSIVSEQDVRFLRLYLFEKMSFLQSFAFGNPWPTLLPWPAHRAHLSATGYLLGESDLLWNAFELDIESISASMGNVRKRISGVVVVRVQASSDGTFVVKFRAQRSSIVMPDYVKS